MKGLIISLFLSLARAVVVTQAQLDVPGVKVVSSPEEVPALDTCNPGENKMFYCSDCNTLAFCGNPAATIPCDSEFPYCNPGEGQSSCLDTPAPSCTSEPGPITCSSVGVLPDPDCTIYHVCLKVGNVSDVYKCPAGTNFNLATHMCRAGNANTCVRIQCGVTTGFVYYGNSRQYYALCTVVNGQVTSTNIYQCPNRATFDMRTKSCVYSCPGQGNFANSNDPATYYQCAIVNGRPVANLKRCPAGRIFNQTLSYCV
ncbi:peritrophin-48-like [Malaya genurostris]|uniref:peritrophin-48-like n=1 Tax=Malaya genurostris TaxID=325434 RepID=UPI0026F3FE55|nr:peritrophin-48-like [Malaya genurostris]